MVETEPLATHYISKRDLTGCCALPFFGHAETRVRVDGLQSAPQHNGTWGQVVLYDRVSGRYEVKVRGNKHLKLKVANVLPG